MEHSDAVNQFEFFKILWEKKKEGRSTNQESWDGRAADWEKELDKSPDFFDGLNARVEKTAEYLREHGALAAGGRVADIGCGPGRFAAEFAKTASHVTALDISAKMLEMADSHIKACGCSNVSLLQTDFTSVELEKMGWEAQYDLVFASLTPAVGTVADLEKLMRMSRGYCFNSSFVRWDDELEQRIGRDVFGWEHPAPRKGNDDWFYAFFNLLWLMDYYPECSYYCRSSKLRIQADEDQARYYAKCFTSNMMADEASISRVHRYLKDQAAPDGSITFRYERWYGWVLWDVRRRRRKGRE